MKKLLSFRTRLLTRSGSTKQFSTSQAALSTRLQCEASVKDLGHDVIGHRALYAHCCALDDECAARISSARSRRCAALLVALSYARFVVSYPFCSRGFVGDKLARRTGLATGFQASGTGGAPVPRACNRQKSCDSHLCGAIRRTAIRPSQLPSASSQHLARSVLGREAHSARPPFETVTRE